MQDPVAALLDRYDRRVPRYTSYPTAPHFSRAVGARDYRQWLAGLDPAAPLSLYVHIPFCDSLCWFCGCHTKIVRRHQPISQYLEVLYREIDLVAEAVGARRAVCHLHFGGGSPSILTPAEVHALFDRLRSRFLLLPDADIAIEIDPRDLDPALIEALAANGVNRASIGLQDLNPQVQVAVNRVQSLEETGAVIGALRDHGVTSINIDLMYGLPHQDETGVAATVRGALGLAPERICLFGYAHVPWMKKHQRLIDETALPGPGARFAQYKLAARLLSEAGYTWIGLDHFARPDDALAVAARAGTLRRNFQGYTTDDAIARIGLGPSAIGAMPQGFVQNHTAMHEYRDAIGRGELPIARGLALDDDDRLRGSIIERLMCDLEVDLARVCRASGHEAAEFTHELELLADMRRDGLIEIDETDAGPVLRVTASGRPFVRAACAAFDAYLRPGEVRHARAV
jgi:oxygen-independent coproporphyrinogen-3 oxidase